jgi:hypothetical protein
MIVDQQVVSRITERITQPTPKVRRSRLIDGIVAQVAATKATNATKVNMTLAPACGSRMHVQGQTAPQVTWQHSLQHGR